VLRQWRQWPLVTATAVLSLALGVGANAAFFSILNALLLKPLPGTNADRLVRLRDERRPASSTRVSTKMWLTLGERQTALDGIAAYAVLPIDVGAAGQPVSEAVGLFVSGSYFDVIGVDAAMGRVLTAEDDRHGAPLAAVVSHAYWRKALGSRRDVLGSLVPVSGHAAVIVGVTEPGFFGLDVGRTFDVALSLAAHDVVHASSGFSSDPDAFWLNIVGRLSGDAELSVAQTGFRTLQARLAAEYMADPTVRDGKVLSTWSLERASESDFGARGTYGTGLLLLLGVASAVLLVACANVANLLLARASANQRDLAIRLSLGAQRLRLIGHALTESFLITILAAALGVVIGIAGGRLVVSLFSTPSNPVFLDVSFDSRVFLFALGVSLSIAISCAALPIWRVFGFEPVDSLRTDNETNVARGRGWVPYALLSGQIAAVFLLTSLGFSLTYGLVKLSTQSHGFESERVTLASVSIAALDIAREYRASTAAALADELGRIHGIQGAALSTSAPFGTTTYSTSVIGSGARAYFSFVTPNYFRVLGMRFIDGVGFTTVEDPHVAVVSQAFSLAHFGTSQSVGRSFQLRGLGSMPFRVTGVTEDIKMGSLSGPSPEIVYIPWLPNTGPPGTLINVLLRTEGTVALNAAVAAAVSRAVPGATVAVRPLAHEAAGTISRERTIALVGALFSFLALLIGVIGLYGVTAEQMNHRRKEIGIRMALGATGSRVMWMILGDIVVVSVSGILAGLALIHFITPRIRDFLFGPSPASFSSLSLVAAALTVVALSSSVVPVKRCLASDPLKSLRHWQ
jgi:putative ABC transport system permease protein